MQNFDYNNSSVIKPPDDLIKNMPSRYTRVVIDSRHRDTDIYQDPANYSVEVDQYIEDVICGEIIITDIPFSNYVINKNNCSFYIGSSPSATRQDLGLANSLKMSYKSFKSAELSTALLNMTFIVLDQGIYTNESLITHIANKLPAGFTISLNIQTLKVMISSTNGWFSLYFPNYLGNMLGMDGSYVYFSVPGDDSITSTGVISLNVENYIVLSIYNMSINVSSNDVINKSTMLVSRTDSMLNSKSNLVPIKKYFNPVIPKIIRIRVKLTDSYGNPYDFQNMNHRIEILYESRRHLMKYAI